MGDSGIYQYSQASLQDFSDCKRRFYYRYVAHLSWPAVETEPVIEAERMMQAGQQFHKKVRQFLSGVPLEKLESGDLVQGDLLTWWRNFRNTDLDFEGAALYPEKVLTAMIGKHKLVGKFDLLAIHKGGRAVIYDWKTSRRQPTRTALAHRWQTIIYPYLLAIGSAVVNQGTNLKVDQISMVYWYANFPDQPVTFRYCEEDIQSDERAILSLIDDIEKRSEIEDFELAPDEKQCKFCVYRSLCDRGVAAGEELDIEFESEVEIELDFDQIHEIEF